MPLAFTSSIPRFSITFNLIASANTITFTDLVTTGYGSYGTATNFKGLVKIADPDGIILYQNAGWSLTAPDFTAPDINGTGSVWTKAADVDLPDTVKTGTYTFTYIASIDPTLDPNRTGFVTVTKTFNYQAVMPTVTIDYTISCRTSELTATDSTDYDIDILGISYTPSKTRTLTLIKPSGAGCNTPAAVSTASITWGAGGTALTELWTNVWQTTVSTAATYSLESWGGDYWFIVAATLTGYDTADVQCDDCVCDLKTCIDNLITSWKASIGANYKRETELRTKVTKVLAAWANYEWAERCGESVESYCEEIKAIVASEDCTCPTSSDTASARVVAWGSGLGQSAASTFAFTVTATTPTGGNSGDVHYNTSNYHLYHKTSVWVDDGSIQGATGSAGSDGSATIIVEHDTSDHACAAAGGVQTLKTYNMPADTIATDGDVLEITLVWELASTANGKTVTLTFNTTDIISYFTDSLVNTSNNVVTMKAWISRTAAATQDIRVQAMRNGVLSCPALATDTADFTGIIRIDAKCTSATSTASDITLKEFRCDYIQIVP